jgi:hypothetical protein
MPIRTGTRGARLRSAHVQTAIPRLSDESLYQAGVVFFAAQLRTIGPVPPRQPYHLCGPNRRDFLPRNVIAKDAPCNRQLNVIFAESCSVHGT